jgi:hypothetical protein
MVIACYVSHPVPGHAAKAPVTLPAYMELAAPLMALRYPALRSNGAAGVVYDSRRPRDLTATGAKHGR